MNGTDIISILAIFVSVGSLIWNYYSNIRHQMFLEKLRVYKNYLGIVADATLPEIEQKKVGLVQKYIRAKQELILVAPSEVVNIAAEIEPLDFTTDDDKKYENYLILLNMMRTDLKKSNKRISHTSLGELLGKSN